MGSDARTGLHLLHQIRKTAPAFSFSEAENGTCFIDKLAGTDKLRSEDFEPESFLARGEAALRQYMQKRADILL